jgi:hypothetical protein
MLLLEFFLWLWVPMNMLSLSFYASRCDETDKTLEGVPQDFVEGDFQGGCVALPQFHGHISY